MRSSNIAHAHSARQLAEEDAEKAEARAQNILQLAIQRALNEEAKGSARDRTEARRLTRDASRLATMDAEEVVAWGEAGGKEDMAGSMPPVPWNKRAVLQDQVLSLILKHCALVVPRALRRGLQAWRDWCEREGEIA